MNDGDVKSDAPTGRYAQKQRTRHALLRATRDMMARQEQVSVAGAAKEAGISVATAYRYFSDPETMRLEAVIDMDMGESGTFMEDMEARCEGVADVAERVIIANRLMMDFVARNEDSYRLFLAKGHEQVVANRSKEKAAPRGGRRLPMIEYALEPWRLDLTGRAFQNAVHQIALVCGPEAYFVLGDLCDMPADEINRVAEDVIRRVVVSLAAELPV